MKPHYILIFFILIFSFSSLNNVIAQKMYVPSAEKYVPINYKDDIRNDLSQYSGTYIYIYPGFDENEQYEGRPYFFTFILKCNKTGSEITASRIKQYPGEDPLQNTQLGNPSIFGNVFNSDELTGKFAVVNYTKNGKEISAKGFLKKHKHDTGYDFYELQK